MYLFDLLDVKNSNIGEMHILPILKGLNVKCLQSIVANSSSG